MKMRKLLKRAIWALAVMAAFTQTAWAAPVTTFEGLQNAISAFNGGAADMEIEIGANFNITANLTISNATSTLTIKSDATPRTLTRGLAGINLFYVDGSKLVLQDITIDGDRTTYNTNTASLIRVENNGSLTLNSGAVLQNNRGSMGSGVYVNSGSLAMTGGAIKGNTITNSNIGLGVYVGGTGGTFTMTGGEISGNISDSGGIGGGVYVASGGVFNMSGTAKIRGNTTGGDGGGVHVTSGGTFNMSGGEISGNTSSGTNGGGGVNCLGTFTMTGGVISGNSLTATSLNRGGGVRMNSTLITLGGTAVIEGNTRSGEISNVSLASGNYITLGTGINAPAPDMKVGVQTLTTGGVIVQSDASAGQEAYFFADVLGMAVEHANTNQLRITTGHKAIRLAEQVGTITAGTAGSATFAVTTANIANGQSGSVEWFTAANGLTVGGVPAGITHSVSNVATNVATVTMTADSTCVEGTYYFKIMVDNAISNVGVLTVDTAAPTITSADNTSVVTGVGGTFQVTATGTAPITYSLSGHTASEVSIDVATGLMTIDPLAASQTFTITATNGINPDATQSFTLQVLAAVAPAYQITASPTTAPFGSLDVGYAQPAAQTITITNTGSISITLTQPVAASYDLGPLSTTLINGSPGGLSGGSATFAIQPKAGLPAGVYNETITISGSNGTSATVSASFTVPSSGGGGCNAMTANAVAANAGLGLFGALAMLAAYIGRRRK